MIRHSHQFRHVIREHSDRVWRTARRILGNDRDAEEATQDVFLKIYRALPDFDGRSKLSTWIYRITVNTCLSIRRGNPVTTIPEDLLAAAEVADPDQSPEEIYERAETRKLVIQLTARLADKEAQAVTLFYLEGLEYSAIGEIMQLPIGSVATILHRGRIHLHVLMLKERSR